MDWLQFGANIAWPLVALIGVLIVGPGGVLKSSIGELASRLLSINSSIGEFKRLTEDFNLKEAALAKAMVGLEVTSSELGNIAKTLETIRTTTSETLITIGTKEVAETSSDDDTTKPTVVVEKGLTPDQMYNGMYERWSRLTEKLRGVVGPDEFDGRAIGAMAWMLADGRRKWTVKLSKQDAELIGSLHSQMKRFNRLYSSRSEWLTDDVFANFIRGLDRAETAMKT